MNRITRIGIVLLLATGACVTSKAWAGSLSFFYSEPFGTFDGVAYERHTGRSRGATALGPYDVPFEIVAPVDAALGNGAVLVEPSHWFFGPSCRTASGTGVIESRRRARPGARSCQESGH